MDGFNNEHWSGVREKNALLFTQRKTALMIYDDGDDDDDNIQIRCSKPLTRFGLKLTKSNQKKYIGKEYILFN